MAPESRAQNRARRAGKRRAQSSAGSARGGPRRARYNVATRGRILDAAARLFVERGYAAVALKDIVAAAGVNGAAVNYHFGDKERPVPRGDRAGPEGARAGGAARSRSWTAACRAEERLRAFIHALMTQLLDDSLPSVMPRLMLREAIEPTAAFAEAVEQLPQAAAAHPRRHRRRPRGPRHAVARAVRRMSISVLGQCVYYRYAEKMLRRIDPQARILLEARGAAPSPRTSTSFSTGSHQGNGARNAADTEET